MKEVASLKVNTGLYYLHQRLDLNRSRQQRPFLIFGKQTIEFTELNFTCFSKSSLLFCGLTFSGTPVYSF